MKKEENLFRKCLSEVSADVKNKVKLSFDIADRIFDILEDKNMSQKEFAKLLGKSESEISKWLTGTHNFTTNTLAKIETVLGESVISVPKKQAQNNVNLPFGNKISIRDENRKNIAYSNSRIGVYFKSI